MACIMALLLGAIYFQQGLSQASIQSRVGAISFSMLLMSFIAFDIVLLFPKERDLYTRESQAGLYGASAFFHARCLAELPGHLTAGGAYATIAYWMMGFQVADAASVSELQLWEDGVSTISRHRDAVDVAARESTGLVREPRRFRDGINQRRWIS